MRDLGLKNMGLVQPEWHLASSQLASLEVQLEAIDQDIRKSTFGGNRINSRNESSARLPAANLGPN